jgi:hypothetical protein
MSSLKSAVPHSAGACCDDHCLHYYGAVGRGGGGGGGGHILGQVVLGAAGLGNDSGEWEMRLKTTHNIQARQTGAEETRI